MCSYVNEQWSRLTTDKLSSHACSNQPAEARSAERFGFQASRRLASFHLSLFFFTLLAAHDQRVLKLTIVNNA